MKERVFKYLKLKEVPNTIIETVQAWSELNKAYTYLKKSNTLVALSDEINTKRLHKEPFKHTLRGCIGAPFDEEIAHRLIPSLLPLKGKMDLAANTASSIYFGYRHNRIFRKTSFSSVPVTQIGAGFLFYDIARKRNVLHSMISHSTWNALCFSSYGREKLSKKFEPKEFKRTKA